MLPSAREITSSVRRAFLSNAALCLVLLAGAPSNAQSNTVENLGSATANQAASGLGFNVNPANAWEFQMAAAAGATSVRFQCGWISTETQTPPPANTYGSPRFVLPSDCQSGLMYARQYNLRPTVLAAYGSPFHAILELALPNGAAAGSTTLNVSFVSGVGGDTLTNIAFPNDTIMAQSGQQITGRHSYAGALITGFKLTSPSTATLTLASAVTTALPASTSTLYTVNEYLHAPAASFSPSDASNLAYAAYAEFLAQSIANAGLQGEVEIWNEPPWADDPWDDRADFYDNPPATTNASILAPAYMPNFGFAAAIQAETSPTNGVTYVWGGTEKSGASSLFNWMQGDTGVSLAQPSQIVTAESMHPYGNTPEDSLWIESCLHGTILPYPSGPYPFYPCNLNGLPGGNASLGEQFSLIQKSIHPSWGVRREITETGYSGAAGDATHKARFVLRQFLGYEGQGVTPIEFYRLFDPSADDFGFVAQTPSTAGSYAPYQAYTAVSGLISDLKSISELPPVTYSSANVPQVTHYHGSYPLDVVSFVGGQPSASANSYLLTLWQRSSSTSWSTLASPTAASVTIALPQDMAVATVLDLVSRVPLAYSLIGQALTLAVSDDPVEVLLHPAGVQSLTLTLPNSSVPSGTAFTLSCLATMANGVTSACVSPEYSSSNPSVSSVQGSTVSTRNAGVSTLTVAASGLTASAQLTVKLLEPEITFGSIPSLSVGGPSFHLSATSNSSGAISYSVVSGPATLAGTTVTPTGSGTIVIEATQAAAGNYAEASAQTSVVVSGPVATVTLDLPVTVVSTQLSMPNVAVRVAGSGSTYPTGTIQILVDTKAVWSYTLTSAMRGSLGGIAIPPLSVGQHQVSAYYAGDTNYKSGVSASYAVRVVANEVSLSLSCASLTLAAGEPLSCTIKASEGATPVTGLANYIVTGMPAGKVQLNAAGVGLLLLSHPPAGKDKLSVTFPMQGTFPACPYTATSSFTSN